MTALQGPMQAAFAKVEKQRVYTSRRIKTRRRGYSAEFKQKIVEEVLAQKEHRDVPRLSRKYGIPGGTIFNWLKRHEKGIEMPSTPGWQPEHGDVYLNPTPKKRGEDPRQQSMEKKMEIYGAGGAGWPQEQAQAAIGGASLGQVNGCFSVPDFNDGRIPELEMKARQEKQHEEENWLRLRKLEHENEVLRRIVRDLLDLNNMY